MGNILRRCTSDFFSTKYDLSRFSTIHPNRLYFPVFFRMLESKETLIGKGPVDHETQKKKIRDWTIALIILVVVGCLLWFV